MRILRVFPCRTSYTPTDSMAFVGWPPLARPDTDEVHVSVAFTWDKPYAEMLATAWRAYYPVVKLGGPTYDSPCDSFAPGVYVKPGVTFTSRGCNHCCPWCLVPGREGRLRLIPDFAPGWIVQDNNLLQTPREHQERVYRMLASQRHAAIFAGGLEARLVDAWLAGQLRRLRIEQVFLACDTDGALEPLKDAVRYLGWLGRDRLRCYVLIGREPIAEAEQRLRAVWDAGCLPFAQLYQPPDTHIAYSQEWRNLNRTWSRPAAIKAVMKGAS